MYDARLEIGGVALAYWLDAYNHCTSDMGVTIWPDGQPYLEQENLVVSMFDLIGSTKALINEQKAGTNGKRN